MQFLEKFDLSKHNIPFNKKYPSLHCKQFNVDVFSSVDFSYLTQFSISANGKHLLKSDELGYTSCIN